MTAVQKVLHFDTSMPSITDVYAAIREEALPEGPGDERRGFCLSTLHQDTDHPSCDYNVIKETFHCKTCDLGGNVLTLVVAAGRAGSNKDARKWLRAEGLIPDANAWDRVDVVYDYTDADGKLVYQVGRWNNPKKFGQRVPDGQGGYKTGSGVLDGVTRYPYKLPDLIAAARDGRDIYVVEGEKDADRLRSLGLAATTCSQGAGGAWPLEWANYFQGADRVVVVCDNDEAGRKGGEFRASVIARVVPQTFIVRALPDAAPHGDVSDFLDSHDLPALLALPGERVAPYEPKYPAQAAAELAADLTDTGNGVWFAATVGSDGRYIGDLKTWLTYDGRVWTPKANTVALTGRAVELMEVASGDIGSADFAEHVKRSKAVPTRRHMLEAAIAHLNVYSDEFDQHRSLLNVANGTLDVHTGELRPHNREDYLTKLVEIDYDADATCPNFERWLDDVTSVKNDAGEWSPSPELREYCELLMGAALEARSGLRRFFYLLGPKGTGKSTFARILHALLGSYAAATDFAALCQSKGNDGGNGPSPALARLRGLRLVTASEASTSMRLDAARIKQLIGGDAITARQLHQDLTEFRFEATLLMFGNEMPRMIGDDSIWEKFKPIPFEHPIEVEDADFEERELLPELPGILALAVRANQRLREARYRIVDPPQVAALRESERREQSPIQEFFGECLRVKASAAVEHKALWPIYTAWCEQNEKFKLHERTFFKTLRGELHLTKRESHGNCFVVGAELKPEAVNRYVRPF